MVGPSHPVPALDHILVRDCMHPGILSCLPDAPLGEVAGMMAKHRVHAVAVRREDSLRPAAVISDLDVVAAIASGDDSTARQLAPTEALSVSASASLRRAAQLMAEHGIAHLLVVDASGGYPVGVLSTLDIAAAYAGGRSEGEGS
jgi:CBS domain-containing protein